MPQLQPCHSVSSTGWGNVLPLNTPIPGHSSSESYFVLALENQPLHCCTIVSVGLCSPGRKRASELKAGHQALSRCPKSVGMCHPIVSHAGAHWGIHQTLGTFVRSTPPAGPQGTEHNTHKTHRGTHTDKRHRHTHRHTHTQRYTYRHRHTYRHTRTQRYTYRHRHIHRDTHVEIHIHTQAHKDIHTHVEINIQRHTHTQAHTALLFFPPSPLSNF